MKQALQDLVKQADIQINGDLPWDIQVKNEDFYKRVLAGGSLALGESYMDGWWECEALDQFIDRVLSIDLDQKVRNSKSLLWSVVKAKLFNQQTRTKSKVVGEKHYDVGNDLYQQMLDKNMCYSCGYWKEADNLDDAQEAKLDLICKKLKLKPGMTVLDIGCGWGSFAKFAAEKYQVKVVGLTISKEQAKLAKERCEGLDVEIRLQDYRDVNEKFDRILSIGMFEHVGCKNYREYFKTVNRCLKDNGLTLIHTIAGNRSVTGTEPWIGKYIFANSMLPSAVQITKAYEGLFRLEDWHNFGTYYDTTLMAWHKNFNDNWEKIKDNYDERFFRMWNYYLLCCAGSFRCHKNQLWQIVFSKVKSKSIYESIR